MSTWDEASPSQEPLFWGRGTITVVTGINAPWYETETRTIGFERYMNFYVPENTYSVSTEFVLADIHTSTSDLEFWVQNRPVLTNRTNDRHCFDSVVAIQYNGYNTYVQFMTFKVTIGDDGHAEIRRVRATNMTGDHAAMYFGFNRPTGTSRQAMTSDDADFFTKAPNISPFAWYGVCSLVKNDTMGPSSDGSFYRYEQLPSSPLPRMPIYGWNLLQTIYANSLDDCPIWTQQWQEQHRT